MEVELMGGVIVEGQFFPSGLFTTAQVGAEGTGGNLSISTDRLTVREGAQVSSTTSSVGRGGDVTVRASDIELVGKDGLLLQMVRSFSPLKLPELRLIVRD